MNTDRFFRQPGPGLAFAAMLAVSAGQVAAQPALDSGPTPVAIPAQPLADAIVAFNAQTGVRIVAPAAVVSGRSSAPVSGTLAAAQALDAMLAGTGLDYTTAPSGDVILAQAETGEPVPLDAIGADGPARLGPLTVTARRTEQSLSTIPGAVTVVDRAQIEEQLKTTRDVGRILEQTVPGFIGASGGSSQPTTIRGRSALVLVNGVPQNQQLRTVGLDFRAIDPNLIERIEVVRGANAVYGFGGTGGVINIITKQSQEGDPTFTTRVGTRFQPLEIDRNTFTKEVYQDVSGRYGRFDYFLGGSFRRLENAFDAEGDRVVDADAEFNNDIFDLNASLGFRIDEDQSLRLTANYFRDQMRDGQTTAANGIPGERKADAVSAVTSFFPTGKFSDPQTSINVTATYDHDDVFGSAVSLQGFLQRWKNETFADFTEFGDCCILDRGPDERIDRRLGFRLNIDTPLDATPLPDGSRLTWGVDGLNYFNSEGTQSEIAGQFVGFHPDITQNSLAGFGQIEVPIGDFLLTGGVRHERFNVDFDTQLLSDGSTFQGGEIDYSATLYNAGLVYFLTDSEELFAGFSQGFDVTQPGRAATPAVGSAARIELEPAVTDSFEIGARTFRENWQASITAFYTQSELASRTINPGGELAFAIPLRQPEDIWGIEATLDVQPFDDWRFGSTFTWQDGIRETEEDSAVRIQGRFITPIRFTGYAEYEPVDWASGRMQFSWTPGFDRFPGSTRFAEGKVEGVFLVDVSASFDVGPGQLDVGIENLLNNQYIPPFRQALNDGTQFFAAPGLTAAVSYQIEW